MTEGESSGASAGDACPDLAALTRFADGSTADAAEAGKLAAHLGVCEACRARLAEIRETEDFLRRIRPGPASANAEITEHPGSVVGRYTLLEQIGEGGFGFVFSARQTEPVSRLVALKILKPGMDSRQVLARFEAERHTLALMDHPSIARVLDAGTTATGRPFFVMELVDGLPITRFCDEHKLTLRERLGLFRTVCAAVQHAHQKGIIHRDIKPSNVMVTVKDGVPIPKVIDFGIAKATDQPVTEHTAFTRFGQFIGTPEYTSPEQAAGPGADVDTRSDVYSLGILLYELLTGATPLDPERLRSAGLAEMQRVIREGETPRPSTRLSTIGDLEEIAASRRIDPRRLAIQLRGDLDWILLKALEKDRTRRYETVAALSEDLRRSLESEPVAAGPPSAVYRACKFARRNRGSVAAAGAVAVVFVAGLGGTTGGMIKARRAERRHSAEAAWANQVASVQADRFLSDSARNSHRAEWETRLEEMRKRLAPEDPELIRQEGLYAVWGWGAYAGSEVRRALETEADRIVDGAAIRNSSGYGFQGAVAARAYIVWPEPLALIDADTAGAVALWGPRVARAYETSRSVLAESDPQWVVIVDTMIQWRAIEGAAAAELAERYGIMLRACDAAHGRLAAPSLDVLCRQSTALCQSGRLAEAVSVLDEYVGRRRGGAMRPSPEHHALQRRLITAFMGHDESEVVGQLLRVRMADAGQFFGWGDRGYYDAARAHAYWLWTRGRHAEAEPVYTDLVNMYARTGSSSLYDLGPLYRLGVCRVVLGRPRDAEPLLREVVSRLETVELARHLQRAQGWLGRCLRDLGRYEEAEPLLLASCRWHIENACEEAITRDAVEQLIELYSLCGDSVEVEAWSQSLASLSVLPPQLPSNLGFEEGVADDGTIRRWRTNRGRPAVLTTDDPSEGVWCARLSGPHAQEPQVAGPFATLMQVCSAAPYRGKVIRITANIRVEALAEMDRAQMWVRIDSREFDGLTFLNDMAGWPIRSGEWKRYGITTRVLEEAEVINYGVIALAGATVWVDDVRVEVAESSPIR